MCASYDPLITPQRLSSQFKVDASEFPLDLKPSLWPGYFGPFIRKHELAQVDDKSVPFSEFCLGSFGLITYWSRDSLIARKTYNARSETVHEKPSYRDAWKNARHCIIPAEAIYEPDWRSGKAVLTRISRADGKPMGIAGIWDTWRSPLGEVVHSFTMLTINADNPPVMRQFHKPDDEKRMVVILNEQDYNPWLQASVTESRDFLRQYPAEGCWLFQKHQEFVLMRRRGFVTLGFVALVVAACGKKQKLNTLPPGSKVLAFGDSVTFGTGAAPGEDWPTRLAGLTSWQIVNAGIPGDTAEAGNPESRGS